MIPALYRAVAFELPSTLGRYSEVEQAKMLDEMLRKDGESVARVIELQVPDSGAVHLHR